MSSFVRGLVRTTGVAGFALFGPIAVASPASATTVHCGDFVRSDAVAVHGSGPLACKGVIDGTQISFTALLSADAKDAGRATDGSDVFLPGFSKEVKSYTRTIKGTRLDAGSCLHFEEAGGICADTRASQDAKYVLRQLPGRPKPGTITIARGDSGTTLGVGVTLKVTDPESDE